MLFPRIQNGNDRSIRRGGCRSDRRVQAPGQGGDPLGTGTGGPGFNIPPEIKRTHPRGALAQARRGGPANSTPSSGSQFYITLAATSFLDGQYTSFGQVVAGMEVADLIRAGDVIKTIEIEET